MEYSYYKTIEKLSKKGSIPGLETMGRLLDILQHPEKELKIIHAAGTNGKGSTLAFLAGILQAAGYRVGRYISPTIQCYEERFQINDRFISGDRLDTYFRDIEEASDKMSGEGRQTPTIFEVETAIALEYFRDERVDYALIETGMGGLLDATNVIEHPYLTILTSISEDHKAFLGDSLEEIALHKAGIIKRNVPVILAPNKKVVNDLVENTARKLEAPFIRIRNEDISHLLDTPTGSSFRYLGEAYDIKLPGCHQVENAVTAIQAALLIRKMSGSGIPGPDDIREGLNSTRWPGRLELIREDPPFYMDGAHNPDGARRLACFLQKHFTKGKIVYIMGVLRDKEYTRMLDYLMPLAARVYVFTPANQRGLEAGKLAEAVASCHVPVTICDNVNEAVKKAWEESTDADCFVLCGSLSFMEEFRKDVYQKPVF
ncbi:MAG: bifunctional folylpolyglutamate synthase/dihydrofolate synthase [Eubacterium sp.]|nr:bifunctional folylpolyglutamate synthase/dihydrofolate synthase [Eubacterium sp.]